ncbi:hypothetical protein ONZ51_g6662 [Trametes cubensis]|uniref:Uncharacterized protein n=1 Tax=Trametes cubensis TaxID=1111947 RepID=A0AAD7TRR0_9APHY|nr:hypothetical protein ONZ51_g6662 [Trametes cubensis]
MSSFDNNNRSPSQTPAPSNNDGYPEQRHAGAVGYGPEYGKGASTGDKIAGLKEEMKGKILRKPDVVEHGRELRTGELKKKQQEDQDFDPFGTAGGDDSARGGSGGAGLQHPPSGAGSSADSDKPNPPKSFPACDVRPGAPDGQGRARAGCDDRPRGYGEGAAAEVDGER